MMIFLPYPDFEKSTRCLDSKLLCNQRVETLKIYKALTSNSLGWRNAPGVRMWRNYEKALLLYGIIACDAWIRRGYKDTLQEQFLHCILIIPSNTTDMPRWCGKDELHASHRSHLLKANPGYYERFNWKEPNTLPLWYPQKEN